MFAYATTWMAMAGRVRPGSVIGQVAMLILHHEAGRPLPATATLVQERARLRAVDAYHLSLGWAGFGYSAMPCASGRVHEGRGYRRSGAHTGRLNRTSLAVMLPGTDAGMTRRQVAAIRAWTGRGIREGAIAPDAMWTGHRDHMVRDCPGDRNYRQLAELNARTPVPATKKDDVMTPKQEAKLDAVLAKLAQLDDDAAQRWEWALNDSLRPLRRGVRALLASFGVKVEGGP